MKTNPSTDEKTKMTVNVMIEIPKGSRNKYQRPSFEEQSSLKKILAGKSGLNNLQYVCNRGLRRQLPHE
jgi:inorganic pyrophosphatase